MSDVWSGNADTDKFWSKERLAHVSYRQGEAYRAAMFFEGARAGKVAAQVIRQVQKMGRGHLLPRNV